MRCSCCDVVLTRGEMAYDLPDGSINDICWSCQIFVDCPELCDDKVYAFEDITEVPLLSPLTKPKLLND